LREFIAKFLHDFIGSTVDLRFIPFYDGAYIKIDTQNLHHNLKLSNIIEDYNKTQTLFRFKIKEIEPNWSLLSSDLLLKYERLLTFLASLTQKKFGKLLGLLGLKEFCLDINTQQNLKEEYIRITLEQEKYDQALSELKESRLALGKEYVKWKKNIENKSLLSQLTISTHISNIPHVISELSDKLNDVQENYLKAKYQEYDCINNKIDKIEKSIRKPRPNYDYEKIGEECRLYEYNFRSKLLLYAHSEKSLQEFLDSEE
jgi:hypothetical protein